MLILLKRSISSHHISSFTKCVVADELIGLVWYGLVCFRFTQKACSIGLNPSAALVEYWRCGFYCFELFTQSLHVLIMSDWFRFWKLICNIYHACIWRYIFHVTCLTTGWLSMWKCNFSLKNRLFHAYTFIK